jgi:uncharacterized protein YecE (DUF72 family)
MPARLHVGGKELKGDLAAYAKRFDLLEVRGLDAPSLRLAPSPATLRRWRRLVPPAFEFAVVAGPSLARLKPGEAFDAELGWMLEAATLLESRVLVIPTPAEVTPSKVWRDRLARLVDRLPGDASATVWEPSGLWEVEEAARLGRQIGAVVAVDPSRDEVPRGEVAYGRLRAIGSVRAFSRTALERVAKNIGERRDAYVVIETPGALKEGKLLRGIVRASTKKTGGLGRLVRPRRAPIEVRDDDEQEE